MNINYHEEIHSSGNGPYSLHYMLAEKVKFLLDCGKVEVCEKYLKNIHFKYRIIIDFFNNEVKKTNNLEVLEIGSSTGFLSAFLRARGFNVYGIDISEKAIKISTQLFGNHYGQREKKTHYDLIYHTGLIGCVDNPKEFLGYYLSILNHEGIMLFNAPNLNSVKQLNELWVDTPPPDLIYLFSKKSFKFMINSDKYDLIFNELFDYIKIFKKNMHFFKKKPFIDYPKIFANKPNMILKNNLNVLKGVLKNSIKIFAFFLSSVGLFNKYDDEYGLCIRITKK
ncbi:MAG: class I SAM-dependent methyltransferase [Candidatus Hodarchaeota archaeon]